MKLIGLLLLIACSSIDVGVYSQAIPKIQSCWVKGNVNCLEQHFGKPDEVVDGHISYRDHILRISRTGNQIKTMAYWLVDPKHANLKSVQSSLPSDDWKIELLPEKNPHVVEFAEVNYSKKLGVSFLTYKQDSEKKVRILYWGGNYKDIQF